MRFIRICKKYPEYIELQSLLIIQSVTPKPLPVATLLQFILKSDILKSEYRNPEGGTVWKQLNVNRRAKLTHHRRPILTHLRRSFFVRVSSLDSPAIVTCFDDITMMGDSVQKSSSHLVIAKDLRPFSEGQIGSYEQRGSLIEL